MPNFGKIYSDMRHVDKPQYDSEGKLFGGQPAKTTIPVLVSAPTGENFNWLTANETKQFFSQLRKESDELIDGAINLALGDATSDNGKAIVIALVKAHQLRELIKQYGKVK